jgi:hypothetical protein
VDELLRDVRTQLEDLKITVRQLNLFNWHELAGDAIPESGPSASFILELGVGMRNAAHLGCSGSLASGLAKVLELVALMLVLPLAVVTLVLLGGWSTIVDWFTVPLSLVLAIATGHPLLALAIVAPQGELASPFVRGWVLISALAASVAVLERAPIGFRRAVLLTLWPIVHAGVAVGYYGVVGGIGLLAALLAVRFASDPSSWFVLAVIVAHLVALALGAYVLLLNRRLFGPLLQVFGDVARYIGLRRYRERLWEALHDRIKELPDGPAIIVTHSLGTVLTVDVIQRSPSVVASRSRTWFVTMASPLDRCFARFFPNVFPAAGERAGYLAALAPTLRWLNVYRPNDPVGAHLESSTGRIENVSTAQTMSWVRSHVGYWGDRDVRGAAMRAARRAIRRRPEASGGSSLAPTTPDPPWLHIEPKLHASRVSEPVFTGVWWTLRIISAIATVALLARLDDALAAAHSRPGVSEAIVAVPIVLLASWTALARAYWWTLLGGKSKEGGPSMPRA